MRQLTILGGGLAALVVLIVLIVANEAVFSGTVFDSRQVGMIGGLSVLAAAIGGRVILQCRRRRLPVLRNILIWMAILAALVIGYWLFGAR